MMLIQVVSKLKSLSRLCAKKKKKKKSEDKNVRECGGPEDCETSRLPHFVDSLLTDGCEIVNLTRRPPFIPRKIPGTHFG
jgi:hypothetical protein